MCAQNPLSQNFNRPRFISGLQWAFMHMHLGTMVKLICNDFLNHGNSVVCLNSKLDLCEHGWNFLFKYACIMVSDYYNWIHF